MKFIENVELENICGQLTYNQLSSSILIGKLEAFAYDNRNNISTSDLGSVFGKAGESNEVEICNNLRKRSASAGDYKFVDVAKRRRSASMSDVGIASKKVLSDVVSALSEIFPDYDYRFVSSHQFVLVELNQVMQEVNSYLSELTEANPKFLEQLWNAIDLVVGLSSANCELYSYTWDRDDNGPLGASKSLWSFHYFFVNKQLQRLCYFGCRAHRYAVQCSARICSSINMCGDMINDVV